MKTVQDLIEFYEMVSQDTTLFGGEGVWRIEFNQRYRAIGEQVQKEAGVGNDEKVPRDFVLKEQSQQMAEELKQWYKERPS